MKKLLYFTIAAAMACIATSCGTGTKGADNNDSSALADSIAKSQADSIALADSIARADSIAKADSIARADSMAKAASNAKIDNKLKEFGSQHREIVDGFGNPPMMAGNAAAQFAYRYMNTYGVLKKHEGQMTDAQKTEFKKYSGLVKYFR